MGTKKKTPSKTGWVFSLNPILFLILFVLYETKKEENSALKKEIEKHKENIKTKNIEWLIYREIKMLSILNLKSMQWSLLKVY